MKFHWMAIKISVVCIAVFILQLVFHPTFTDEFSLVSSEVLSKPWMLISHIFLHGSTEHLLFNLIALAMFGSILESVIGQKKFMIIFFVSGIIAGISGTFFYQGSLGASGAIMGVMGTLAILRPKMTVYVSYIPMPMSVAVLVWALGDLLGYFNPLSNVAHIAHIVGLVIGVLIGLRLKRRYGRKYSRRVNYLQIGEDRFRNWEDEWL